MLIGKYLQLESPRYQRGDIERQSLIGCLNHVIIRHFAFVLFKCQKENNISQSAILVSIVIY